ncbi:phage tail length tape measure family protein [Sphingomonas sp. CROZ-RG-20F-R02-07]|uniref:phage tail length tape measure family protein n=1 Tax=Sphingomonas sp. CROZ-RG-20F-R02-07 TaxID=2914832 RepID=UPI003221F17E
MSLNRAQVITAQSAVLRFADSVMAGQSPLRAFALEAHKGVEVLSMDNDGMGGGLAKVTALFSPMNLMIGASVAAIGLAVYAAVAYANALESMDRAATGFARTSEMTGAQLEAFAQQGAASGSVSVASARETELAILQMTRSSGEALTTAIAISRTYADEMGVDMKEANKQLGAAMTDPTKGAEEMAAKFGLLTAAQVDEIRALMDQNRLFDAQNALMHDVQAALDKTGDHVNELTKLWRGLGSAMSSGLENAGRGIDAMLGMYHIAELQKDRLVTLSQGGSTADIDKQIAEMRAQAARQSVADHSARTNQLAQQARGITNSFTGEDKLDELKKKRSVLQDALRGNAFGGDAEASRNAATALDAYTNAIRTYLPPAEQHLAVRKAQEEMAHATTKAEKALAGQHLEEAQNAGKVQTSAERAADAMYRGERAADRFKHTGDKHAETLAREAAAMDASARGALDVADAYLKSSAAGVLAEARRKASTDATRKGIDVEAQARRQLAIDIAEGAANGAKAVATLSDETAAREKVNAAVAAGTISVDAMNQALADQNVLRPLIAMRDAAEGDAKAKLTTIIDGYTAALTRSHAAEAATGVAKAIDDSRSRAGETRATIEDMAHSPLDGALNAANRAANRSADAQWGANVDPAQRTAFVSSSVDEAQAKYQADRQKFIHDTLVDQRDGLALSQRELALAGANDNQRDVELDKLRLALTIRRQFPDMAEADVRQLLAGVAAQDEANDKLKVMSASLGEMRSVGDSVADTMLSPDAWRNWGNAGRTVLKEIEDEFLKLILLNPLKNMLNGNSNLPTAGSLLGSIFGDGGAGALTSSVSGLTNSTLDAANAGFANSLVHNASGTENFSGGRTWVNENGPEIEDLPSGTRIYPAALSRQMAAAGNDNGGNAARVEIHLKSDMLDATIADGADGRIAMAAPSIVAGGAQMGNANATRARRRQMGTRG